MNNEIIALIGFVTSIVVSAFTIVIIILLIKRTERNSGLNNIVYNTEQMKELLTKYYGLDTIKNTIRTKGILEHPSSVQPEWLTHLYVDNVENDGEFPDKKKLYNLLNYTIDYVGSWTRCDDVYSSQQMKDILPLLVRCKNILENKGE